MASWITSNRERLDLSQEELADQVGVGQQAVSSWERGKSIPGKSSIERLSTIFHENPPTERHLRSVPGDEQTGRPWRQADFTWERFTVEVFEPRVKQGPLSDAEVFLLRDAARTIYGLELGDSRDDEEIEVRPQVGRENPPGH